MTARSSQFLPALARALFDRLASFRQPDAKPSERLFGKFDTVTLPPLPEIPGMVTSVELRYLYWLLTQRYSGHGAVVEVGPWMGRSTSALAAGLRDSGFPGKVHTFDQFKWVSNAGWEQKLDFHLENGADFLPCFLKFTEPFSAHIHATKAGISELEWHGGPVEILFLDAPKQTKEISKVLTTFAPNLRANHSYIVSQDYLHGPSYALLAMRSILGDALELVHTTYGSSTVGFVLRRKLTKADVSASRLCCKGWSQEESEERWARMAPEIVEEKKLEFTMALACLLHANQHTKRACELGREIREIGLKDPKERRKLEHWNSVSHLRKRFEPVFDAALAPE